jgi:hypothetical protein
MLLAVSPNDTIKYGDPLLHAQRCIARVKLNAEVQLAQFPILTWYGNHPTDPNHQIESKLVEIIEQTHASAPSRSIPLVLAGFSKSGFGALSFLRPHPNLVDGVIVWDAPLTMRCLLRRSMTATFGDDIYFQNYRLVDRPVDSMAGKIIILGGWSIWGQQVLDYHLFLQSKGVEHRFLWGPKLAHRWDSGWLEPCLLELKDAMGA